MLTVSFASLAQELANTQTEITGFPHSYKIEVVNGDAIATIYELEKEMIEPSTESAA